MQLRWESLGPLRKESRYQVQWTTNKTKQNKNIEEKHKRITTAPEKMINAAMFCTCLYILIRQFCPRRVFSIHTHTTYTQDRVKGLCVGAACLLVGTQMREKNTGSFGGKIRGQTIAIFTTPPSRAREVFGVLCRQKNKKRRKNHTQTHIVTPPNPPGWHEWNGEGKRKTFSVKRL